MKKLTREEKIANCVSSLTGKPDFPTFSERVQRSSPPSISESTVRQLTEIILRDYSLSLKLLRTANLYNLSGRQIVSVSHAVIMLGTEGVRNLATSLLIFEHFCKKPSSDWIRKVLEAIHEGAGFDRVLFGFRSEDGRSIEGRIGVGKEVDQLVDSFQFRMSLSGGPVPLALLLRHTVASDTSQEEAGKIARLFGCRYLCLFPVVVARQVVGCFYGENLQPRPDLTERQIRVLEELRTALENAIARVKRRLALADTG